MKIQQQKELQLAALLPLANPSAAAVAAVHYSCMLLLAVLGLMLTDL